MLPSFLYMNNQKELQYLNNQSLIYLKKNHLQMVKICQNNDDQHKLKQH
uniref:Uncharacterized protein n=1 Tax=Meloidogyne enterolobii TaxID=390850 RepID=A0A6V7X8T1_MELEN|nr:unnamed protein product [Meloidogyne enterolobii]